MTCGIYYYLLKSFTISGICAFCEYMEWIDTTRTVKCYVYGLTTTKLACLKFKMRQEMRQEEK